ncbi:MAG: M48 family metalloprotease, partial [Thermaerobacterales bacterium]
MLWDRIETNRRRTVFLFIIFFILAAAAALAVAVLAGDPAPAIGVLVFAGLYAVIMARAGNRSVLAYLGAREASPEKHQHLFNIVEGLALAAQTPTPRCYIIDSDTPNAFATGWPGRDPAVCVTTGLLTRLNREELEGVIAHEMAHIANHDTRVMITAFALVAMIAVISDMAIRMLWFNGLGGGGRAGGRRRSGSHPVILIVALAAILLAPLAAQFIKMAVSRQREYLADAEAVRLTRNPHGLIGALEKISTQVETPESETATVAPGSAPAPGQRTGHRQRGSAGGIGNIGGIGGVGRAASGGGKRQSGPAAATAHLWIVNPLRERSFLGRWL